ncbi:MAG: cell division protein FtsZ, partial [Saprospiraceae bacterium]
KQACLESLEEVTAFLMDNTKMLFVTAGMGGGTGTGAAPIIAKAAKDLNILTVGIVTIPFTFEGRKRNDFALEGLAELKDNVDALIVISNDKLREIYRDMPISDAFAKADDILTTAAKGIAEIITVPGYINVDFEDVNTVMRDSGVAIMGSGQAEGENRARMAVENALSSPLLEDNDIRGAQHILLNITSGKKEVTMDEVTEITEYVQHEAGYGTNLIWGNCFDESLGDQISVTIIATGFEHGAHTEKSIQTEKLTLEDFLPESTQIDMSNFGQMEEPDYHPLRREIEEINNRPIQEPVREKALNSIQKAGELVSSIDREEKEESRRRFMETENRRREQLRNNILRFSNPQSLIDLEATPAYVRRKVVLEELAPSSESKLSRMTFSADEEPELRSDNTFLHDNVD